MSGSAGLHPAKGQRRGVSVSRKLSQNLRVGCVGLVVGPVVLIGEINHHISFSLSQKKYMHMHNALKLSAAIIISELAGIVGAIYTTEAIPTWYATLIKPAFNPPSWVFGPVWTTLYALMGIAAFFVWKYGGQRKDVRKALCVFGVQLILNAAWSIVFFGFHSPFWALVDIIALWVAIMWTMILFYKISKPAMWLLVPYILWVSFALYLNYSILILNA